MIAPSNFPELESAPPAEPGPSGASHGVANIDDIKSEPESPCELESHVAVRARGESPEVMDVDEIKSEPDLNDYMQMGNDIVCTKHLVRLITYTH
jgi:hypothetical protein